MKNIILIITDQHKHDALSLWGKIPNLTPNIDRIAEDGITFSNAYTPSPVCGPARASLFTGQYGGGHGVVRNWLEFKENTKVLPERLQDNGYLTFLSGKLHFMPHEKEFGFTVKHLNDAPYSVYSDDAKHSKYVDFLHENYYKDEDVVQRFNEDELAINDGQMKRFMLGSGFRKEKEHDIPWTSQNVIDFLEDYDGKKPFFLNASYFGPHHPYLAPEPYDKMFQDIELPANFDADMSDKPIFNQLCKGMQDKIQNDLDPDDYKRMIQAYYGQVKMIDDYIGHILKILKSKDLYDDTTIIFTSDHGDYLGSYGLFFKGEMYDASSKVPFIMKPAGNAKKRVCDSVINSMDLYATILEIAGLDNDSQYSNSLMKFFKDHTYKGEGITYSVIEHDYKVHTMCRTAKYKLMKLTCDKGSDYELYDLERDIYETDNIWEQMRENKEILEIKEGLDEFSQDQYELYMEVLQ